MQLKILTFNIFTGTQGLDYERLERQINLVKSLDADVICLQEVFDPRARIKYKNSFAQHQIFFCGKRSDGFMHWTCLKILQLLERLLPKMRRLKNVLNGDRFGLLILLHPRLKITHVEKVLTQKFKVQCGQGHLISSFLDLIKPRGLVMVSLKLQNMPLVVCNAHFANGVTNERRIHQVTELLNTVSAEQDRTGASAVICCDSNSDADTQPEMLKLRAHGWQDTFAEGNVVAANVRGFTWDNQNPLVNRGFLSEPDQRVDVIYHAPVGGRPVKVLESRIVLHELPQTSDHYGVLSTVEISSENTA